MINAWEALTAIPGKIGLGEEIPVTMLIDDERKYCHTWKETSLTTHATLDEEEKA